MKHMLTKTPQESWLQFLEFIAERCTATEYENWFASIRVIESDADELILEIPNIFVQEYVLDNYKKDLCAFLPLRPTGELAVTFRIASAQKKAAAPLAMPEA